MTGTFALLILLLPLIGFLALGLIGNKLPVKQAGYIGVVLLSISTALAYYIAWTFFSTPRIDGVRPAMELLSFEWLRFTPLLAIRLGIYIDALSSMMLVVITTVSLMVHIYSLGYMKGEKGFQRYYAFLSLFTFSMLGLVVAPNIFQTYIFWELVGVSSYLLIGFYYTKPEAVSASKKAFIVTRFADLGFLIGILILSYCSGTFDFTKLCATDGSQAEMFSSALQSSFIGLSTLSWATLLIFMGCAGKSAMFPLHIWLPDAMEGPTPVSALIHAATMVVAGVFLVARLFPIYSIFTPDILHVIAYIGAFTSLYAAIVACYQTDIKRVLAFSTISQIGFMMVALGVSGFGSHAGTGYMASLFHLFTHAFFKALLFLGAGAIIHAVHSNEMNSMGGLRKALPITHITFLIACLAIAGIPPLSGFFSKDEILSAAFSFSPYMGVFMTIVAGLTAFYMFRLYYRIFWGEPTKHEHPLHESPLSMNIPLIILATITIFAGFIPFGHFLSSDGAIYEIHINPVVAITSVLVALTSIGIATYLYGKRMHPKLKMIASNPGWFYSAAQHRFYIDSVYLFITHKIIFNGISEGIAWFDRHIIDGTLSGIASLTQTISYKIRVMQSGQIQTYSLFLFLGALGLTLLILFI